MTSKAIGATEREFWQESFCVNTTIDGDPSMIQFANEWFGVLDIV